MKKNKIQILLLFAVISIYLYTHFVKIEDFPIYFFSDEAVQALKAEQLLKNGFRDESGSPFPLFFRRFGDLYNLGITVYFQIPTILLFGKKIFLVRGTTVIISLLGSVLTALILKNIYKLKNYWIGILFLSSIPLFFLHSRTGFEPAIASSLYAGFLYFYLLYRTGKLVWLFPSIIFAALAFYSYSGIMTVILSTGLILAIADLGYHLKHIRLAILGTILAIIVFIPLMSFVRNNQEIAKKQFEIYGIFLTKNIPTREKINKLVGNYRLAINPIFLFVYDSSYHIRHYLKDYGYFPTWSFPLIILGLLYMLINIKRPAQRVLLLALIASPLGGVILNEAPGATRIMPMVITLALIFGLGIKAIEFTFDKFLPKAYSVVFLPTFLFFALFLYSFTMTHDAIKNGPLWFQDYTLYGMQYGAKQLFAEVQQSLKRYKNVIVSTGFANSVDIYFPFFLTEEQQKRARLVGVDQYNTLPTFENTVFILGESEYNNLLTKKDLYRKIELLKIIPAPNNKPQFFKLKIYQDKET